MKGWSSPRIATNPEEAAEFVFWLMQPENLAVYAYQNGMIPANSESLEVDPF